MLPKLPESVNNIWISFVLCIHRALNFCQLAKYLVSSSDLDLPSKNLIFIR